MGNLMRPGFFQRRFRATRAQRQPEELCGLRASVLVHAPLATACIAHTAWVTIVLACGTAGGVLRLLVSRVLWLHLFLGHEGCMAGIAGIQ